MKSRFHQSARIGASLPLVSLGLLALASGCNRPAANPASGAAPQPSSATTTVTVVKPERKTLTQNIPATGEVQAFQQTPLYAKVAGYVEELPADMDIGKHVRKGEVLARLSVPELVEELAQKAALVEQAKAEIDVAERTFEAAKASFETARSQIDVEKAGRLRADAMVKRWQTEFDYLSTVVKTSKTIDQQTLDLTTYQLDAAKAARQEVEAKIKSTEATRDEMAAKRDKAGADILAAKARHRVAVADRRRVAELLKYTEITAPFDGIVTRRNVDTHHFVQPAASGSSKGEPLFVVVQMDPVRIFVDVPEDDAALVTDGTPARVRVQARKGEEFVRKVTRSAWALDTSQLKSRTLRTEIDLPNPDGKLRPGMYATATITVEHRKVWTVPASAIAKQGEQTFCYRVEDGRAIRTQVQVGARSDKLVELVRKKKPGESGDWVELDGKEQLIAANIMNLVDGQEVQLFSKGAD